MDRELAKLRRAQSTAAPARPRRTKAGVVAEAEDTGSSVERLQRYLDVAKGEIERLDYIVTQFLQAIRPSTPQLKDTALNTVVEETLRLLGPELENRGLEVKTRFARALPQVPLDAGQIKQVLVNLIKNAMHAMNRGGVLTLSTTEASDGVAVSIADTGAGMSQEQLARIFEPFFTTKSKGTGLGLMIVQRIVRDHGGRIDVESREGKGTTFTIWLPARERKPRLLQGPKV
jgi:signal transduction histidine kinase